MGIATHTPSGMLWIAIAMPEAEAAAREWKLRNTRIARRIARSPSATPIDGSSTVAMKVARPSGKLWSAIATAVSAPIFLSCASAAPPRWRPPRSHP